MTHDETLKTDPLSAVPAYSGIVIETVDIQSFFNAITSDKGLFGELKNIEEFGELNRKLKFISDNLNKPEFRKMSSNGNAALSICRPGDKTLSLYSVSVPKELSGRNIRQVLTSSGFRNYEELRIKHRTVFRLLYPEDSGDTIFISSYQGLFLMANSSTLIRDALVAAEHGNNILNSEGFMRVNESSGDGSDKIFLVFRNLPSLIRPLLSFNKKEQSDGIADLAKIVEGDITIRDNGLVLNGYALDKDSARLLSFIKDSKPIEFHNSEVLPSSTVLFETVICNEKSYNPDSNRQNTDLKDCIGTEITRAYIDLRENTPNGNKLILFSLKDTAKAKEAFMESHANVQVHYFNPDKQVNIPVYRVPPGITGRILPQFSDVKDDSCVAFYKDYMVAGSSFNVISKFLYDNHMNNTLVNNIDYREFENTLPSRGSFYFYCVPPKIIGYLDNLLSDEIIDLLKENKIFLNKINSAGIRLSESNGMIYSSLSLTYSEQITAESLTEWETLLDTTASGRPFFFTNHLTGAREIFVQDLNNTVYLINAGGRLLWMVPLKERITGNVFMIDYFDNGKNQLLFGSKNYIHLIDRNGNYVDHFPVKLKSPATNPLALFDYDSNGNYRILSSGEDRLIYCYDKTGNTVKGWKPFRTAGLVRNPLNFFRVAGKDYIVASDDKSIYLLDRNGHKRLSLKQQVTRARGSTLKLNDGSESFLICSSPSGKIQQIYFDGTVKKFSVGNFSADHSFDIFDTDGDGLNEYIITDRGKLFVYDQNRILLFSREIGSSRISEPLAFSFSASEKRIGFLDLEKNLIYLINDKGENIDGFPLSGATLFSIGKLTGKNNWNLIVGGSDRFLYNYILTL